MIRDEVRSEQPRAGAVRRGLLLRYRVMAFSTAALLIILVFVGIPLQLAAGRPGVVNVVGTLHGFLYIAYLCVAFSLTRRLGIPKWQMALVLLAGTVPFCAFVAERKMTRRFEALTQQPGSSPGTEAGRSLRIRAESLRQRWLSRRALLLHLEVAIVAPGCAVAGWWQATRALAGNELSWVYTVEWPVFALLAIGGWWHLVHEDPKAYRARKAAARGGDPVAGEPVAGEATGGPAESLGAAGRGGGGAAVDAATARGAAIVAALVGFDCALGIVGLFSVPFSRPSGWLPAGGRAVYLAHASFGLLATVGAAALLVRVSGSTRTSRIVGWMGFAGLALAGAGGLLTEAQAVPRFLGMLLMFVGPACAGFAYMVPTLLRSPPGVSPSQSREAP